MVANEELTGFVREALGRGLPRDRIRSVLGEASWSDDQVESAFASFAEVDFPLAVPRPRPSVSAREAFEYLVLFGTLYVSAIGLGNLLFQLVNLTFPDPLWPQEMFLRIAGAVRFAIASLIVAAPIFVYIARANARAVAASPLKRTSPVRQWLTYLTLAVAAAVLIGDGTRLVYSLLAGELTIRFVLKALTIGVIAGTAFLYYLRDLRRGETEGGVMKASFGTTALVAAGVVGVAAIVTGVIMVGTPTEGRLERLDARRVQDLRGIMQATDSVWARSQRLPTSLQELADDPRLNVQIVDPGSGEQYEYTVVGEDSYELCATFDRESPARAPRPSEEFWRHGPGRHCFALSAIKAGSEGGT